MTRAGWLTHSAHSSSFRNTRYVGQQFTAVIRSSFLRFVDQFELTLETSTGLQIQSGTAVVPGGAVGSFQVDTSGATASCSFNRRDEQTANPQSSPTLEPLLSVQFVVTSAASSQVPPTIRVLVNRIRDSGNNIMAQSINATLRHRGGVTQGSGPIYVGTDDVVGFFACV